MSVDRQQREQPDESGSVEVGGASASVKFRRTKGRQSLKRLSDIMSAYIPVAAAVGGGGGGGAGDYRPLLETQEEADGGHESAEEAATASKVGGGYRLVKLLDLQSLQPEAEQQEELQFISRDVANVAVSPCGFVFLGFRDSSCLLRLQLTSPPDANDTSADSVSKEFKVIRVKVRGADLTPVDVKSRAEFLFVSGCLSRAAAGNTAAVAKFDLEGRLLQVSKELPEPKFFGFDVDSDGQLVMASPPPPESNDAQIFKMSDDFKRKLFKIQLGTRTKQFRPEFVACLSSRCWVSTQQRSAGESCSRRLLSFPLRPPASGGQAPTKSWLKVSSWKFDRVQPARLLAVGGSENSTERLLLLDKEQGNIFCLTDELGCSALTHPASDGGQRFTSFCCLADSPSGVAILASTRDSLYLVLAA